MAPTGFTKNTFFCIFFHKKIKKNLAAAPRGGALTVMPNKLDKASQTDYEQAWKFVEQTDSVFAAVMVGATFIEGKISEYLDKSLGYPEYIWEGQYLPYGQKLKIALSVGYLQDTEGMPWRELIPLHERFGTFRNKFAHKVSYKLKQEDLELLKQINYWFSATAPKFPSNEDEQIPYTKHAMTVLMAFAGSWAN